jgi:hypothetical protein
VGTQIEKGESCTWIVHSVNEKPFELSCQLHARGVFQGWILNFELTMEVVWTIVEYGFPTS